MIRRSRSDTERELPRGERLIQDGAARRDGVANRRQEIALQVPGHDDEIETPAWKRTAGEVGAPDAERQPLGARLHHRAAKRVLPPIDAEYAVPRSGQRQRMAAAPHRDVERALRRGGAQPRQPLDDEGRGYNGRNVAQALLSAVGIGLVGLIATVVLGLSGADVGRHISFGIFSTLVTLLAHSMMMFYLIGKGKAVKDAMAENNLTGDYYRRIAVARKPVFSIGTLAMAATMVTAILGASVDTGVLPPIVHGMIAYGAIAANLAAGKIEIDALSESSRIVDEVNHLIVQRGS